MNTNDANYKYYGARGILVHASWIEDFKAFLSNVGLRPPSPRGRRRSIFSLERINTDGNYEPGNCVWATAETQQNNKRNSRIIAFNGENLTLAQLSHRTGVNPETIASRIARGLPMEKVVTRVGTHRGPMAVGQAELAL